MIGTLTRFKKTKRQSQMHQYHAEKRGKKEIGEEPIQN